MSVGAVNTSTASYPYSGSISTGVSPHGVPAALAPEQRDLIQAVKAIDSAELFGHNNELTFVFDRDSRRTLVRVVDRSTHEVILQVPAERVIEMAQEANAAHRS
jgi:uncharacterized FlaG/YvyC family protein